MIAVIFRLPRGMIYARFSWPFAYFLSLIFGFLLVDAVQACGNSDPCAISGPDGGTYYFAAPSEPESPEKRPVFVFFHGHSGSGAGVIRNKGLVRSLNKAGFVVVAPDGPEFTFNGRTTRGWAARPEGENPRGQRDDIKFVENVLRDVAARSSVDIDKTVVSGFSSGGSMAWFFSCYSDMELAGVAAVAGGLRRPLPPAPGGKAEGVEAVATICPGGPRKLIHIHGFSDRQVPLEGRGIRSWHQGDVFEGLSVQRQTNQCGSRPDKVTTDGAFWCREWNRCESGQPIRFCLHEGGHGMPKNWLSQSLDWLGK
ncbi:MAG: hypothetical protein HRU27_18115 [Rhizobiaceae bacterium]|nr:hypothetical protein [Rhizobiaceae bacterium]